MTPAVDVPYKYTGKPLDSSTSLYYYGARYYDPVLARFLSADTVVPNPRDPQALNRYTYAGSNPFLYTDPTGHFKINFNKFFKRALGDVGTAVVGVLGQGFGQTLAWSNPLLGAMVSGLGTAVLTQSKTGRYALAGEIVVATIAVNIACAGTCAPGTIAVAKGALVGTVSTGTLGAYSAAKNGGDTSKGLLFGTAIGVVTGAIAGGLYPGSGGLIPGLGWQEQVGLAAAAGLSKGIGYGAADAFAGGKGNLGQILRGAALGGASNAFTAGIGGMFDASWQQLDVILGAEKTESTMTLLEAISNLRRSEAGFITGSPIESALTVEPGFEVLQEVYGDRFVEFIKKGRAAFP